MVTFPAELSIGRPLLADLPYDLGWETPIPRGERATPTHDSGS
jgi:hypothetical protein